ncbi:MAG: HIT domain-containing protein [Chloroflexi bacterium]|nr:HIT domain-containing protein [Chloroflexota bacterium]
MEIKWTPWRGQFVKGETPKDSRCVLCVKHEESNDAENHVLYRGQYSYVLMNLYPYNPGHLMIVPYAHTNDFANLPAETAAEIMHLTQRSATILSTVMNPHGYNLGMNLGRPAGAGIDEHLHMHIVPRWNGDTNFMPLIGGVKLIPEAMDDTYAALVGHFQAL